MKILLIYPYVLEDRIHVEDSSAAPIGLYYVGAMLRHHGHQVHILNSYHLTKDKNRFKEIFRSYQPDLIGFSILNANRFGGIEIAQMAKQVDAGIKIVFGGIGATYLWNHFLTHFEVVDYVVLEEGEYTFLELVNRLEEGDTEGLAELDGVALRLNGEPIRTSRRKPIPNLDKLPDPARFFVFQHVALTRGCPGNCTFCGSPGFWRRRVRFHSSRYFVEQLQRLYQKGVQHFYFCDDTFTLNKDLVIEVCKRIIARKLNITWVAISKVTYVDAEILGWMRQAGCTQISYGIESGNQNIRELFGKKIQESQIENAFKLTVRYGILARAYFIYGAPHETLDTISQTLALIQKIKPLAAIFYILALFPGTALYDSYQHQNDLTDDIWLDQIEDILYFETDGNLSGKMVTQFGRMLRTGYHNSLSQFAEKIELIDLPEFYPLHADFLSRLGMTFSHGDYAAIETITRKEQTAILLYQRALKYYPDLRAYLGLGMLYQQQRIFSDSIRILEQGLAHFPDSQPLSICLGISLMNIKAFEKALRYFEKFPDADESHRFVPICKKEIIK
jgi:anaerobic magnesium-protoporphyrin IX monomethyl ester cyclase